MSKEAMKLALDALEGLFGIPHKLTGEGSAGVAVWRLGGSDQPKQAITALRKALANEALERMAENARELGLDYDTPAQRPWVGLTDEEILAVARDHYNPHLRAEISFALAIEAKLRSKNT